MVSAVTHGFRGRRRDHRGLHGDQHGPAFESGRGRLVVKQAGTAALAWAIMAAVSLCPIGLAAHQINLSNARIELKPDRTVRLEIALRGSDVDRVAGTKVFDAQSGLVDAA